MDRSGIVAHICLCFATIGTVIAGPCDNVSGERLSPDGRRCVFHGQARISQEKAHNECISQGGTLFQVLNSRISDKGFFREIPWMRSQLWEQKNANERYWYGAYRFGESVNKENVFNTKAHGQKLTETSHLGNMFNFKKPSAAKESRCARINIDKFEKGFHFAAHCQNSVHSAVLCHAPVGEENLARRHKFKAYKGKMLPSTAIETLQDKTLAQCAWTCGMSYYCFGFQYNSKSNTCELVALTLEDAPTLADSEDWDYHELLF